MTLPSVQRSAAPVSEIQDALHGLRVQGFVRVAADLLMQAWHLPGTELGRWNTRWNELPPDNYLRDGGRYRYRRHSCFIHEVDNAALVPVPQRPHWQPATYNALHGGLMRWFEPIDCSVTASPAWSNLLVGLGTLFAQVRAVPRWFIEAHQFRITTDGGIGRPTPEGAHRDGVDFVAVILVARCAIRGGETRVFAADGPLGVRFTIEEPWSALLLDDTRVIHETTPIQPENAHGWRDTLVLTYRANAFQAPET